jgi:CHAT domain-containing protein/tetratricopeptide (TPR) repeat protein
VKARARRDAHCHRGSRHRSFALAAFFAVWIAAGCVTVDPGRSANDADMLRIAGEIRALPAVVGRDSAALDARLDRLLDEARRMWAQSPSRSASVIGEEDRGYEIGPVYEAVADSYVASGRTGRALHLLEEACDEARALRYYGQWQELSIQLVQLYRRLGMVDHARDRISPVLQLLARFGYSLSEPPIAPGRDQVIFLELHAAQLGVHPESYVDPAVLRRLYALLAESSTTSVEAWGWKPDRGLGFMGLSADFAVRLAELGDLETARRIRDDVKQAHRKNRATDPFVLANERGLDFSQTRLGRDVYAVLRRPFATSISPIAERIGDRPPRERRFLVRSPFLEAADLARIDLAIGDAESALAEADRASRALSDVEVFYERSDAGLAIEDRLPRSTQSLVRLRAEIFEALGRDAEAEALYESYVEWSERERESLPVEQRIHFFRGQARSAYQGAIRTSLRRYLDTKDSVDLDRALSKAERMRSRGFQDLLGAGSDMKRAAAPTLARLAARLGPGEALLQLIDLGDEVATVFVSSEGARAQLVRKGADFRREIFRLRNRLAIDHVYDAEGFDRLGGRLIGFLAGDLERFDRLYVMLDGPLTAIPPSILPYEPGRLLHDHATLTLVPSLAIWLDSEGGRGAAKELRALVVADPIFDDREHSGSRAERAKVALRGDASRAYFQPLPETAEEARSILSALEGGGSDTLLLGEAATESSVKALPDLARFTHIHFATHGVIGSDLPGLSEPALVLGWEPEEDGLLTTSEVAGLDLGARLTVLSACNTGNGEYFAGEGLMGLGRAFMLAGSDQVVVSLWPVESFSTQRLMETFYERLARGESEERALWHAQHVIRRERETDRGGGRGIAIQSGREVVESPAIAPERVDPAGPFYWSPFVLISTR